MTDLSDDFARFGHQLINADMRLQARMTASNALLMIVLRTLMARGTLSASFPKTLRALKPKLIEAVCSTPPHQLDPAIADHWQALREEAVEELLAMLPTVPPTTARPGMLKRFFSKRG